MSGALDTLKKQPIRQVKTVQHLLWNDQARDQLAAVAAKHMNPERMMRVVANAIRTTPKLQECEPMSFLGGLMQCASLGLEPNTILGHAYLIPFENKRKGVVEVQLVVGYKGLIDLARRSGHITSIHAGIHYSDDEMWEYEEGTEAMLRHRPGPQDGKKLHSYAIAKFKDGGHAYVVLPWSHVMKIRDGSQGYQTAVRFNKKDSPWIAHEDAMAKKTAIRALAKYLPLSVEFVDAMSVDGQHADYRAFAMDPSSGIAPISNDYIDGEAEDASGDPEQTEREDQAKDRQKVTQKAAAKDEPAEDNRPNRHELQKQHQKAVAAEKAKVQPKPAATREAEKPAQTENDTSSDIEGSEGEPTGVDPYANQFAKAFLADVSDMGWDAAMDFHGEEIDRLMGHNRPLYDAIRAEAARICDVPDE